jgi:predicted DNA-binding protein (UPF0278 family)
LKFFLTPQLLLEYFEDILSSEIASDGVLAQDESQVIPRMISHQFQNIWKLREFITEGLTKKGAVYKYDISVPNHLMYEIVQVFRKRLENTSLEV